MAEAKLDSHELDELTRSMLKTAEKLYPKQAKAFLNEQGMKGRKTMKEEIRSRAKGGRTRRSKEERKTSLARGASKGKVHKHKGDFQVRVLNKAPHAWLAEHGHRNVKTRSGKSRIPVGTPVVMVPGRGGAPPLFVGRNGAVKQVPGLHYAAAAANRMKADFPAEAERFVDELMKEGLEL